MKRKSFGQKHSTSETILVQVDKERWYLVSVDSAVSSHELHFYSEVEVTFFRSSSHTQPASVACGFAMSVIVGH